MLLRLKTQAEGPKQAEGPSRARKCYHGLVFRSSKDVRRLTTVGTKTLLMKEGEQIEGRVMEAEGESTRRRKKQKGPNEEEFGPFLLVGAAYAFRDFGTARPAKPIKPAPSIQMLPGSGVLTGPSSLGATDKATSSQSV